MTGVLVRRGRFEQIQKHSQGRSPWEERGRNCSDVATSQGIRISRNQQKLGRGKYGFFHREIAWPSKDLDFKFLASRTVKK